MLPACAFKDQRAARLCAGHRHSATPQQPIMLLGLRPEGPPALVLGKAAVEAVHRRKESC